MTRAQWLAEDVIGASALVSVFRLQYSQQCISTELLMLWIRLATSLLLYAMAVPFEELPAGTVVPVMISTGLNAEKDQAGKQVEGRVMQDVPLPEGEKIKRRARIIGHVVSVTPSPSGSSMVVKFDTIEDGEHTIHMTAALLALASFTSVADAQAPINSSSDRDPVSLWVTRQVGGDFVNRGRGKASSRGGVEGTWLEGSSVLMKLTPNPAAGCPGGGPGYDRQQAVWVFSSAACGTYGFSDLKIANSRAAPPLGEIGLKSGKNIVVRGGSGWLLIEAASE